MRTLVLLVILGLVALLEASPARACKIGPPPPFDARAGSSEPPPAVQIQDVAISLGANFGKSGPGDCSDLGRVAIRLAAADGSRLDGRFGAQIVVVDGELPAPLVDLATWVGPIQNNQVFLTLASDGPAVDFTVAVQAVNAAGQAGEPSASVHRSARADGGCHLLPGTPAARPTSLLVVLALALVRPVRRALRN